MNFAGEQNAAIGEVLASLPLGSLSFALDGLRVPLVSKHSCLCLTESSAVKLAVNQVLDPLFLPQKSSGCRSQHPPLSGGIRASVAPEPQSLIAGAFLRPLHYRCVWRSVQRAELHALVRSHPSTLQTVGRPLRPRLSYMGSI